MIDLTRLWPFGLDRRRWPFFAVGLLVVLALLLLPADHLLSGLASRQSPEVVAFFNGVTRWGEADWILYPSAALLLISAALARLHPDRIARLALIEMVEVFGLIFVGVGLPGLVSNLLKRLIGRARPELFNQVGVFAFHPFANDYGFESFPSGHTTTAFAAAMVLGFLAPRWFGLGLLFALAIAASRLVVGAHYPTDVLAGAVLGTLGAYAVRNFFATRRWGLELRPDGRVVPRPLVGTSRLVRRFSRGRAGSARGRPRGRP